jgi:hypothetical protein
MSAYQCWLTQRERLRESLSSAADAQNATFQTRHTLAQVEQDTMAEQSDDLLRQQTGILFSCVKQSLNLLDIPVNTKVWLAAKKAERSGQRGWRWMLASGAAVFAACGVAAWLSAQWLMLAGLAAGFVLSGAAWLLNGRAKSSNALPEEDRIQVTARPDAEKLFHVIDAQMRAIDRYINDFAYLNEQSALTGAMPDHQSVSALAELLQAVFDVDGTEGEDAVAAAERLLAGMGIRAMAFSPQEQRLFTVLPSISETRTLTPALVSAKDGSLLHRGTAAVYETPLPSSDENNGVSSARSNA